MQGTKYICYQESDTALIKKTALAIFKSMILPYLEYGNIFYGTCSEFNKYKLQVIQNNGLKIALNRNVLYNTVDLHIEATLFPCKYRRLIMLQKNTFRELQDNLEKLTGEMFVLGLMMLH